ncbi:hypothetical protein Tco_0524587 [Tanacetum coccineum]
MTKTMEQYMSKTHGNYGSGVVRPKINGKTHFELKDKYLKELRENTFSGSEHEDTNEHIEKVFEIVDLFHIPEVTQDQVMLRVFPMSLTGADLAIRKSALWPVRCTRVVSACFSHDARIMDTWLMILEMLMPWYDVLLPRDDREAANTKLLGLNALITQAEEEIETKEAQIEAMNGAIFIVQCMGVKLSWIVVKIVCVIVGRLSPHLRVLEQLLAATRVGIPLKAGYAADMKDKE